MRNRASSLNFTGSYLDKLWTRRFILGSVLQNYDPRKAANALHIRNKKLTLNSSTNVKEAVIEKALLRAQRLLSEAWNLPAKMLDPVSEQRIFRLLAKYASCEGVLSIESLKELDAVMSFLPGAPKCLSDPRQMEMLLYALGYAEPGENLHRISFSGKLKYSPEAEELVGEYVNDIVQHDGGDAYDVIREVHDGPGYAIDSATTSEVDDAIGVEVSPTGEEWFTVYVSDATVYCPYDSGLEHVTARALATTTYLPESVFFMLPKAVVEAATLREDRPCRTFNIRFQVDASGNIQNYSVHVGWLNKLRRLTYEQMQNLVEEEKFPSNASQDKLNVETENLATPPAWLRESDVQSLERIYRAARCRFETRMKASLAKGSKPIDSGLPDPYIKVDGTKVVSLKDQILSTQEARLAVAEMMIAANEVCSRIAQDHGIPIPFRGTRCLSSNHEAAQYFKEPQGVVKMNSVDSSEHFQAESMQETLRALSGVTRAVYHPSPLYHAGLATSHYTHSTSPLRRYPDMLVHHQLKVWLYTTKEGQLKRKKSSKPFFEQLIPEYTMTTHCVNISKKQELSALLQDKSSRYWILRYMEQQVLQARKAGKEKKYLCFIGETKNVSASPEYNRFHTSFEETVKALTKPHYDLYDPRWKQGKVKYAFVSQIYLPEVQLTHTIYHNCSVAKVGVVIECRVHCLEPVQGALELELTAVKEEGDEKFFNRILQSGIIERIDA